MLGEVLPKCVDMSSVVRKRFCADSSSASTGSSRQAVQRSGWCKEKRWKNGSRNWTTVSLFSQLMAGNEVLQLHLVTTLWKMCAVPITESQYQLFIGSRRMG